MLRRLLPVLPLILIPGMAQAYIGPGLGAGAIAAAIGVVGSFFLAIVGIVYYPIKRARKKRRAKLEEKANPGE